MQDNESLHWLMSQIKQSPIRDEQYYVFERALLRRGDEAVPVLLEMTNDRDAVVVARAEDILSKIRASSSVGMPDRPISDYHTTDH